MNLGGSRGIAVALVMVVAIASWLVGAIIGSKMIANIENSESTHEHHKSRESNFLGIDQEGFYTYRKRASWGAISSLSSGEGSIGLTGDEVAINEIMFMFAHLGTATIKITTPGLYVFYYSITPPDPDDSYLDLKYLQVVIMKQDAIRQDGTVDLSKVLAWEIYKYNKVVKVQFYADTPGLYIAAFGPADGSIITLKAYKQGIPIHNMLKLKVVSASNPAIKGEILEAETLDLIITKINNFIIAEKVLHAAH